MPKDAVAPEPQPQYEGYRWLGSDWGRSGNSTPARLGAIAMGLATVIVYGVAIKAIVQDARFLVIAASLVVGTLTALAGSFYLAEAHFASRAAREQQPFTPSA